MVIIMKITIEHEGLEVTIQDDSADTMEEVYSLIQQALLGVGFHPNTVKEYFEEL